MMKLTIIVTVAIVSILAIVLVALSLFIVDQTQYAIVLRFGEIRKVISEPGLYVRTPFVDNVVRLSKRYYIYDIPVEKIITLDKKTMLVDSYAIWRIDDPKKFLESVRTVSLALSRIDDVVYSGLRNTLAKLEFDDIVTGERQYLVDITDFAKKNLADFGIEIRDVRIKHTDLPTENQNAVFERMKSERQSIAALIRAEGQKEAQKIRSEADKQATIIRAQAMSEAERIKGSGEASATRIYAEAFSKDYEFYKLLRTLESYKTIIPNSVVIVGEDLSILQQMK
ncbi:membrane protein [Pseudothermotoga hypogea DSM 11164 = NBRC 106472]|uniref:Protein HflC n=2 Tax=Pseudothermotoga hypogea TaxID=57487 RepID=A0A0X1KR99_9THEM|nr:membrane protein [Pseudothermotoga hypogea DSM 11164 = NBRC 106472]